MLVLAAAIVIGVVAAISGQGNDGDRVAIREPVPLERPDGEAPPVEPAAERPVAAAPAAPLAPAIVAQALAATDDDADRQQPAADAPSEEHQTAPASASPASPGAVPGAGFDRPAATARGPPAGPAFGQLAQFQLPAPAGPSGGPTRPVTQFLTYQYSIGSESDITARRNRDLDSRLRDNFVLAAPQVNGYVLYRPDNDTEMLLEMLLERELPAREEKRVSLPNGEIQEAPRRHASLPVDQAWVKFKHLGPVDLTVGRRNFEDERHWLYDTSLDAVHARARLGDFSVEAAVARKDLVRGDLMAPVEKGRINRYLLYGEYRGIEDIKLAAYGIYSHDTSGQEGRPRHLGLRAYGTPSDRFSFWSEAAILRGRDEQQQRFAGRALDLGLLYRFPDLPMRPSITVGYATATGDDDPGDGTNRQFRQTGLESNEVKGAGVSKYKYYGETLAPELSNLRIYTLGLGFRPAQNVFVDLLAHRYRLNKVAEELRNAELTAAMNQNPDQPSKDVGSAFDVVVGLRNLFGQRRLGLDIRAGIFRPGRAFQNDLGDPGPPVFSRADKSISAVVKLWW